MISINRYHDKHQGRALIFVPLCCISTSFYETHFSGHFVHYFNVECNCPKKELLETA